MTSPERSFVQEEWLSRAEMIHLANVHAFHVWLAETDHLPPDHETAHLRDEVNVVITRDEP